MKTKRLKWIGDGAENRNIDWNEWGWPPNWLLIALLAWLVITVLMIL